MKKLILTATSAALLMMSGAASASQDLAQKNACLSCHAVDTPVYGPAFKDVAAKYAGNQAAHDMLVAKVKAGGKGVWGRRIMPANPGVKPEDLDKIISWVLGLPGTGMDVARQ
ncbi:MAG: cytochrome c [Pseudomonadota bacterium]|nr:cytochrome c [Pseudomonadota bacterium]